ncbi:MAG: DNA-binding domain-containing protein [Bacillota bacterium]
MSIWVGVRGRVPEVASLAWRVFTVEDDASVRRMLRNILEGSGVGVVVGESGDGEEAQEVLLAMSPRPDLVFVDILLPRVDGLTVVERLRSQAFPSPFIVISQVSDPSVVSRAYQAGVEFFVRKPLNFYEVLAVSTSVMERRSMGRLLGDIKRLVWDASGRPASAAEMPMSPDPERALRIARRIFSELGILGEPGCRDLFVLVRLLAARQELGDPVGRLQDVEALVYRYYQQRQEAGVSTSMKAIQQRIRRAVAAAQLNMAALALEDYGNDLVHRYGGVFFDFVELRNDMRYPKKQSPYRGRVSIRKFIEALSAEVTARMEASAEADAGRL